MKKHCSGLDVNGYEKEREEGGDLVERESVSLDGVGWMGFAGTKGEELDAGRVYPGQGAEGVASVTSKGEGTYMPPGLVVHKGNTGWGKVNIDVRYEWWRGTGYSHSILRNVSGEEGNQEGEVAQGEWNEGEQTVSDSTSQVEFQKG